MTLDLRHALRRLYQKPGFSFAAIATLALGIGFNTVVFSVVNFLVLRPLPIEDPDRLVSLQSGGLPNFSFPNYLDVREANGWTPGGNGALRKAIAELDAGWRDDAVRWIDAGHDPRRIRQCLAARLLGDPNEPVPYDR